MFLDLIIHAWQNSLVLSLNGMRFINQLLYITSKVLPRCISFIANKQAYSEIKSFVYCSSIWLQSCNCERSVLSKSSVAISWILSISTKFCFTCNCISFICFLGLTLLVWHCSHDFTDHHFLSTSISMVFILCKQILIFPDPS